MAAQQQQPRGILKNGGDVREVQAGSLFSGAFGEPAVAGMVWEVTSLGGNGDAPSTETPPPRAGGDLRSFLNALQQPFNIAWWEAPKLTTVFFKRSCPGFKGTARNNEEKYRKGNIENTF